MNIYTARVGYMGADALDITAKSASPDGKVFAPPWGLLRRYLPKFSGRPLTAETFAEYEQEYLAILATRRIAWPHYLSQPSITLLCYCPTPVFCHRGIVRRLFEERGAVHGGEVTR